MSWLREPTVHFLVLGVGLFLLYDVFLDREVESDPKRIVVTPELIAWLNSAWARRWSRPPTPRELEGLVEDYIREEVYYREAIALGLERDDTVVRRRLAQKFEFLVRDLGGASEPATEELRAFFEANAERYRVDEQRSFAHVYFNVDKRGARAEDEAIDLLATLRKSSEPSERATDHGDVFLLPRDVPLRSRAEVERQYGAPFAAALFDLEVGTWHGPIRSGYGLHLVLVTGAEAARVPALDEVRDGVRYDLLAQRRRKSLDETYRALREKYEIVVTADVPLGGETER